MKQKGYLLLFFSLVLGSFQFIVPCHARDIDSNKERIEIKLYSYQGKIYDENKFHSYRIFQNKVRKILSSLGSKSLIEFSYIEPKKFGDEYIRAIGEGVSSLNFSFAEEVMFGATFKQGDKTQVMAYFDPKEEANVLKDIQKRLRLLRYKRRPLYLFSTIDLYNDAFKKKKIFFKELSLWFDVMRLKGDEENLKLNIPILIIKPHGLSEEFLSEVSNIKNKVILWDPYHLSSRTRGEIHQSNLDNSLINLIKDSGEKLFLDSVVMDYDFIGVGKTEDGSEVQELPFLLDCKGPCLKSFQGVFSSVKFIFAGGSKSSGETTLSSSGNVSLQRGKDIVEKNIYSDFSGRKSKERYGVVQQGQNFLIFNDIDFVEDRFSVKRDELSHHFINDNIYFFMSNIHSFLGINKSPYDEPRLQDSPISFNYLNAIRKNNESSILPYLKKEEEDISRIQRKIIVLESELYTAPENEKGEELHKELEGLREKLRAHYARVRLLKSSITEQVEKAKLDFYKINYACLILMTVIILFLGRKVRIS